MTDRVLDEQDAAQRYTNEGAWSSPRLSYYVNGVGQVQTAQPENSSEVFDSAFAAFEDKGDIVAPRLVLSLAELARRGVLPETLQNMEAEFDVDISELAERGTTYQRQTLAAPIVERIRAGEITQEEGQAELNEIAGRTDYQFIEGFAEAMNDNEVREGYPAEFFPTEELQAARDDLVSCIKHGNEVEPELDCEELGATIAQLFIEPAEEVSMEDSGDLQSIAPEGLEPTGMNMLPSVITR